MDWIQQRGTWFIALGLLLLILAGVRYNKNPQKKADFWTLLMLVGAIISLIYAILWFSGLGKVTAVKDTISGIREEAGRIVDRVGDELHELREL